MLNLPYFRLAGSGLLAFSAKSSISQPLLADNSHMAITSIRRGIVMGRTKQEPKQCNGGTDAENCERNAKSLGMCTMHYARYRRAFNPDKCCIEDCDGGVIGRMLCDKHLTRFYRHGTPFAPGRDVRPPEVVFAENVMKTSGCYLWTGKTDDGGYGFFHTQGKGHKAHRYAYEQANGPIPEGKVIRHLCDIPSCVKPDHLAAGTPAENVNDAAKRARLPRGIAHHNARYTDEDIAEIRRLLRMGLQNKLIAEQIGCSRGYVSQISIRKRTRVVLVAITRSLHLRQPKKCLTIFWAE